MGARGIRWGVAAGWAVGWYRFWRHHLWVLHWQGHSAILAGRAVRPVINLHRLNLHPATSGMEHGAWLLPSVPEAVAQAVVILGYALALVLAWFR
ncbi:MAG: hypothetical protein K6U14_11450 [Firmicutes bacterium]|nr:hypothetical protein [Alicyclobacillaceae bacterium]MCL6498229.1 hypothetical protein [Bacillota bacterium]